MQFLAAMPEVEHRRFRRFGAGLARQVGVTREYVRQILSKLQQGGWLTYELRLSSEAQAILLAREREQNGQLAFPWAWLTPWPARTSPP
jgi:hypothetical protein